MSKKDYEAFAAMVKNRSEECAYYSLDKVEYRGALEDIAQDMADHFAAGDPRFDRARFLKACGF